MAAALAGTFVLLLGGCGKTQDSSADDSGKDKETSGNSEEYLLTVDGYGVTEDEFMALIGGGKEEGDTVEVFSFGEQIASLPLHEDGLYLYLAEEKRVMRIPSEEFAEEYKDRNLIVIKEGKVRVKEADCPDLTCVRTGARSSGEIICLPHGLTLKIAGGLEGDA